MHLKQRIKRNSLNCSAYIWVLPDSDSSWSASPQKLTDLEQIVYSQWIFTVIGTWDFNCMFQHTRLRFSLCTCSSFHRSTTAWVSFSSFYHVISGVTCSPSETICGFLCTVARMTKYLIRSHFLLDVECFIHFSLHNLCKRDKVERRDEQKTCWMQIKCPPWRSALNSVIQYHFDVFLWSC